MKNHYPHTRGGGALLATWAGTAAVAAVFLGGSPLAMAAAPAAGSKIGNVASASYYDTDNKQQSSSSNSVETTVLQVGSFSLDSKITTATPLDVINTKAGSAGATIYASHVLTNTGNGQDAFTIKVDASGTPKFKTIAVYADTNGDGLPDGDPLCTDSTSSGSIGCAVSTPTSVAGNVSGANNKYNFVVAYTLPATATGTGAYDIGKVTVAPVASSVTAYGYAATNQSVQVQDSVNLTTSAAFSVSKSIGAPNAGIYPPGALTGTWPSAIGNNPSSGSKSVAGASCATTWSTGLASTASCTYITYTISYTNNGAASGRFNLQDVIGTGETAGLTYVTGSAKWSGNANTSAALSESSNSGFTGADFNVATTGSVSTLTFVDGAVAAGGSGSLSFVVLVNSSATKGGDTTSNAVKFNPLDATGANAASPALGSSPSTSNKSVFLVAGSYGVAVGAASSATSSDAKDATAGTPNATSTDAQTNAKATAGSSTSFTHKVYNLGDDDIVNVTVASSTFPTGTTFRFYKADGTTELSDHNNDGIPDTDTIKGGDVATIVVKAFIPATTAPNAAANYTLTLLGTSVTDATKKDAAKDTLVAVVGAAVDLTNSKTGVSNSGANADVGQGPSAQPTLINASVPAGSWTTLDLWITNNDTQNNTYTLVSSGNSSLSGSLPVGWTVKYVTGAVAKTACAAASGIDPSAISVNAGQQQELTACISIPATQALTNQAVYFRVRATGPGSDGTVPVDTLYDQINVIAAALTYSATIDPAGGGSQVVPAGSVTYAKTISAGGTGICQAGQVTVELGTGNADAAAGWSYAMYANTTGTLNPATDLVTAATVPGPKPGQPVYVWLKVFAPGNAAVNTYDDATVTVTFPESTAGAGDSCGTVVGTARSTVVLSQIVVSKLQALNATCDATGLTTALANLTAGSITAKPGQCVVYQVTASNNSTSTVTNLSVSDTVPTYTTWTASVQPATGCTSTNIVPTLGNSGAATYDSASKKVSCDSGANSNTVSPTATATLTFQVQLDQ